MHQRLYQHITAGLCDEQHHLLDGLLEVRQDERLTDFNRIKQVPNKATLKQMNLWSMCLKWLCSIIDPEIFLKNIAHTKIRQFAAEASVMEVGDLKDIVSAEKRHALLLCFIHQAQVQTRDQLVTMFLKRMRRTHNRAKEKLRLLQEKHREIEEQMMAAFSQVLHSAATEPSDGELGTQVRTIISNYGGIEVLSEQYEQVSAYHNKNHIDGLFTQTVNWQLIRTHFKDIMQVVLSIQAGKVTPSMLLQKLGVYSRKNKLYLAFRELGRVIRTLFLLEYIGSEPMRREIRGATTKIESFNNFRDWVSFGGHTITSGDPVEREKRLKYINLVANVIMLHNVVDLTEVLNQMVASGHQVTEPLVQRLSPYMTKHIKRFGQYVLDMDTVPEPLEIPKLAL